MSGGISAIKGFEYQATVILDRLFDHFERHGPEARARPEGLDDLDLTWEEGGLLRRLFVQVKKPREDALGSRAPRIWSITEAAVELMPGTLDHLRANRDMQVWVLGDAVSTELKALLDAKAHAPIEQPAAYWSLVHALVRQQILAGVPEIERRRLGRWRVPADLSRKPEIAQVTVEVAFETELIGQGLGRLGTAYRAEVRALHAALADILDRVSAEPTYGLEAEVQARVQQRLHDRFGLSPTVIERTLFRNLRGFIQDISKQIGRSFDREEFELEVRTVWPHMTPIVAPPALEADHVPRPDVVEAIAATETVLEATGVAGIGKSSLASEVVSAMALSQPAAIALYAEVRPGVTVRDVLVGAAFHLRRRGHPAPFAAAIAQGSATSSVLDAAVRAFADVGTPVWLLLDCVEGHCDDAFATELTELIRRRGFGALKIVVLAQERALAALSLAEQIMLGATHVNVRGFSFEEFAQLAAHHGHVDRAGLYDLHRTLAAGRDSGLTPQFASALAHLETMADMAAIASGPPEERLAEADRRRFDKVAPAARAAAERLVLFALPFSRSDAEAVLPDQPVGAALQELERLGLLRRRDAQFEMHELVRAGLEASLPVALRLETHLRLAQWYGSQGFVAAQINHLVAAREEGEARALARETFLRGAAWNEIAPYVVAQQLASPREVLAAYVDHEPQSSWLLPRILAALGDSAVADDLLEHVVQKGLTGLGGYQRGWPVLEAILELDPGKLRRLVEFVLDSPSDTPALQEAVAGLVSAHRRVGRRLDDDTLALIRVSTRVQQRLLSDLLWLDGRAEALALALELKADVAWGENEAASRRPLMLSLDSPSDVAELLTALPWASPGVMLAARSVMLEVHADLLWSLREALARHLPAVSADAPFPGRVKAQALRLLVFLAHPETGRLATALSSAGGDEAAMASIVPALAPGFFDLSDLEARLSDRAVDFQRRLLSARVLQTL